MLRQNIFVGISNTHHYPRYLLDKDDRVSTPIMPYTRPGKTLEQPYSRVGMGDPLLMDMLFDNVNAQEGNHFIIHQDNIMLDLVLPNLPRGSRIWFFKHSNIDKYAQEQYDYLEPVKHSKYFLRVLNFKHNTLDLDQIKKTIKEEYEQLDKVADAWDASPWKVFNLGEYFEDGTDQPTELLVRTRAITLA
jgi:hypothetical protein